MDCDIIIDILTKHLIQRLRKMAVLIKLRLINHVITYKIERLPCFEDSQFKLYSIQPSDPLVIIHYLYVLVLFMLSIHLWI